MRVVYSTAHRDHDPVTEIETGVAVAPYERPERAEVIRDALSADPDFATAFGTGFPQQVL